MAEKVLKRYFVQADAVRVEVSIVESEQEYVRGYYLNIPEYGPGTKAMLDEIKKILISDTTIRAEKMLEQKFVRSLKQRFKERASAILSKDAPKMEESVKTILVGLLLHEMLGLGKIELMLGDPNLEEIVVNSSAEPAWVYHKEFGWLKTNVVIGKEEDIQNYASIIARRVGKQISILNPLLDAHIITGDRANATLSPISGKGNTITIRRFKREPWTVTDFIRNKTANSEAMALIWLAIQYELSIVLSGGTASGKTSFLNVCMPFIQPNHRIISIEDTREIQLPSYLHWVPLTTREPNPEGKGGVSMLDLLVNSLRMRPDRIIVGEIRRQREAEVMFEAMHTGHSVYTTVHANTADETIRRLTNPPIDVPPTMLDTVHLNVVMFRNRRLGVRRVLQIAEFIPTKRGEAREEVNANVLYRWMPKNDSLAVHAESIRFMDELSLHTGLTRDEISTELKTKKEILDWLVKQDIHVIEDVGKVFANYYADPDSVLELAKKNKSPKL